MKLYCYKLHFEKLHENEAMLIEIAVTYHFLYEVSKWHGVILNKFAKSIALSTI